MSSGLQKPAPPHHYAVARLRRERHHLSRFAVDLFDALRQHESQTLAVDRVIDVGRDGKALARFKGAAEMDGNFSFVGASETLPVGETDLALAARPNFLRRHNRTKAESPPARCGATSQLLFVRPKFVNTTLLGPSSLLPSFRVKIAL